MLLPLPAPDRHLDLRPGRPDPSLREAVNLLSSGELVSNLPEPLKTYFIRWVSGFRLDSRTENGTLYYFSYVTDWTD